MQNIITTPGARVLAAILIASSSLTFAQHPPAPGAQLPATEMLVDTSLGFEVPYDGSG